MTDTLAKIRTMPLIALGSEHDGERATAMRKVETLLKSSGMDSHSLAASIGGGEPPDWEAKVREAYELGRRSVQPRKTSWEDVGDDLFVDCQDAAEWLLDNHSARLGPKNSDFLNTMLGWRGEPTRPQAKWLNDLCRRYGYTP